MQKLSMSSQRTSKNQISELDNLSRTDGSAILCQGKTTVQCGVYGPTNVNVAKEDIEKANVDVILRPIMGQSTCHEKSLERMIRNTMENIIMVNLYPYTSITINVQVMCNAGSLLSCCINCACLALMDSGLSMKCLVSAVTCAIMYDDSIIIDPSESQEFDARAILTFVFESKSKKMLSLWTKGHCSSSEITNCLNITRNHGDKVFTYYKETAQKRLCKELTYMQISDCIKSGNN
ncbi:Exosome complex component RRP46 [Nymphon striatum]|nr:Exosome complex component RRP46 [Nymphon striatum]